MISYLYNWYQAYQASNKAFQLATLNQDEALSHHLREINVEVNQLYGNRGYPLLTYLISRKKWEAVCILLGKGTDPNLHADLEKGHHVEVGEEDGAVYLELSNKHACLFRSSK